MNSRFPAESRQPLVDAEEVDALLALEDDAAFYAAARRLRDARAGDRITYSPKVFLPLTRLCRDVCHYCTFATTPRELAAPFLSIAEQLAICEEGAALGCTEALFTLGEKPELRYRAAREALAALGFASTIDYLRESAGAVLAQTGLLPHVNPGTMEREDIRLLRPVSASMGIMLETASARLCERGMPHHGSPDKEPWRRIRTLRLLGEEAVPTTSGILIGIGETRRERVEALLVLRDLHDRYGHLQEVIVQNFRAKPATQMAAAPEPELEELCWTIAVARRVLGAAVSIQAPPNLSPGVLPRLIDAGIDDWGGVSPLTRDHVNPEAPWPHRDELARSTAAAGKVLAARLPVYPAYLQHREHWLDPAVRGAVLEQADGEGLARSCTWRSGDGAAAVQGPPEAAPQLALSGLRQILARMAAGAADSDDVIALFTQRERGYRYVLDAADARRRERCGDVVSFVVNRNINYSNVCAYACSFCAFSKRRAGQAGDREPSYDIGGEELARRVREAWDRGATEVCLQGGIHPGYTGQTYLDILDTVRAAAPGIHIHAFSPLEVTHGAQTLGISRGEFIAELQRRGLGSMPGTAAEILCDELRAVLCPDKLSARDWLAVVGEAHRRGLPTTATIMFGHIDSPRDWAAHLLALLQQQRDTGGFSEFVPLPFVAREAPLYRRGQARPGPTFREAMLMHAIARLLFDGAIDNIQASWVKLGFDGVAEALRCGVNDLGGTLMNESITRAAGASHGQEWPIDALETFVARRGRTARQRTTLYGDALPARTHAARAAVPLVPVVNDPAAAAARSKARLI